MYNTKEMDSLRDFAEYVQKQGWHGNTFCSAVLFAFWWRRFCARAKEVVDGNEKTKVLEEVHTPLFYSQEDGNNLEDPRLMCLRHKSVV